MSLDCIIEEAKRVAKSQGLEDKVEIAKFVCCYLGEFMEYLNDLHYTSEYPQLMARWSEDTDDLEVAFYDR